MTGDGHVHDCPACDSLTFHGVLGWIVAIGFFVLWLTDSVLSRILTAIVIEWVS